MLNYAEWPRKSLSVDALRLDPSNPRLPVDVRNKSQARIRDYLIRQEDVRDNVMKISTEGYVPFKPLYVCYEKGKYVVLEGNRRTCAMQVMRDAEKAPEDRRSWFRRITRKIDTDSFAKVPVVVFPSRDDARRILFFEHAMPASKRWNRQQKMNFIAESVRYGATVEEISKDLQVPVHEIKGAVVEFMLQDLFEQLGLDSEVFEHAISPSFPLSTLSRIVQHPTFKKATGFNVEGSTLEVEISEITFKRILKSIIETLSVGKNEGGVDSRTLNSTKQVDDFVTGVLAHHPPSKDVGSYRFSPEKIIRDPVGAELVKSPRRKQQVKLIDGSTSYNTGFPKLDMLIEQGQKMPATQYCVAGGLLLRSILELAVYRLFDLNGDRGDVIKSDGRIVDLTKAMRCLVNKSSWFINGREQIRKDAARFCQQDSAQYVSVETLNRYVHGPASIPTEETLRAFWLAIEPLVSMCCEVNAESEKKVRNKA